MAAKTSEKAHHAEAEAEEPTTDAAPEPAAAPEPVAAPEEPKFSKARLLTADGEVVTGYPAHYLAGALYDANDNDEFTAAQAQKRVENWLAAPVATDNAAEEG